MKEKDVMDKLEESWIEAFRVANHDNEWVSDKMLILIFNLAIESAKCMFRKALEEPKEK